MHNKQKNYLEPIVNCLNLQKPNLINEVFIFFHKGLFHIHELPYGCQAFNMNIILRILIDVYKHFNIFNAQLKTSKVCENTFNVEKTFCFHMRTNNPQYFLGYKPNIRLLYLMHFPPCQWILTFFLYHFSDLEVILLLFDNR